jgi:hypothetical protein
MIRDLSNAKCSFGYFEASTAIRSIKIPNDAKGVKVFCETDTVFFNVDADPGTPGDNTLTAGGFAVAGILEPRILQDGVDRTFRIKAANTCSVLIEFWG